LVLRVYKYYLEIIAQIRAVKRARLYKNILWCRGFLITKINKWVKAKIALEGAKVPNEILLIGRLV